MDNIKTWTGLPVAESVRMTEINGESTSMVWPTLGSSTAEEQNRTDGNTLHSYQEQNNDDYTIHLSPVTDHIKRIYTDD